MCSWLVPGTSEPTGGVLGRQVELFQPLHLVIGSGGVADEAVGVPLPAQEAAGLAGLRHVLVEPGPVGQPDHPSLLPEFALEIARSDEHLSRK